MTHEKNQVQQAPTALLSGASGVLGSRIATELTSAGWQIKKLVRQKPTDPCELQWHPNAENPIDAATLTQLQGLTAAVHLSGANVAAKRWTPEYKKEISESRVGSTRALARVLAALNGPPRVLVSASAIGFYGDRGDEPLDESSPAGNGFFPELCQEWEGAAEAAAQVGIRVVHPRFGVVLSREGGALAQMKTLFKLGLGGKLGNGKQWMSWVAEEDAVQSVLFALTHETVKGPYNAVSPHPATNAKFTRELASVLDRPAFMAAPAFALRLAFGEMADEALLASTRAVPRRLEEHGFSFLHPDLDQALRAALALKRQPPQGSADPVR